MEEVAVGVVPVADENFVGIEAAFLAEEFRELGVTGKDLVGRGPLVVSEVIAAAVIDRDLNQ